MDEQKHSLVDRIKQAQNILVTVSRNPSVDQLAAAIGLTIALNKLDKHGTAVFSGQAPSTLEFLKPDETLEKNTDSLRDFIIALDKSKADKLRYKVEDDVVRIFITPYKTSLSEKDLQFSQGDFNVDVVVGLGVTEQQDLDAAITAHGRILHDATVASVSTQGQGSLGTINWVDPTASSLSEMMVGLIAGLDKKVMDNQIATALLTGIVATTDRFRNEKTSPKTMSASAELMAAGANQQLIASELEAAPEQEAAETAQASDTASAPEPLPPAPAEPGTLEIDHESMEEEAPEAPASAPEPKHPQVHVDENGQLLTEVDEAFPPISQVRGVDADGRPTEGGKPEVRHERITEPPKLNDADLTANTQPEGLDPSTEELTLPSLDSPLLTHNETMLPPMDTPPAPEPAPGADIPTPAAPFTPPPASFASPAANPPAPDPTASSPSDDQTLAEIEASVDSPHVHAADAPAGPPAPTGGVDDARSAVEAAYNQSGVTNPLEPIAALNAQPLGSDLHEQPAPFTPPTPAPVTNTGFSEPTPGSTPADDTLDMPLPSNPFGPSQPVPPSASIEQFQTPQSLPPSSFPGAPQQGSSQPGGQTPPPPVPPPMLPPLQ